MEGGLVVLFLGLGHYSDGTGFDILLDSQFKPWFTARAQPGLKPPPPLARSKLRKDKKF